MPLDVQETESGILIARDEETMDLYIDEALNSTIEVWVGDPLAHFVGDIVDWNSHQVSLLQSDGSVLVIRRHHIVIAKYAPGDYPRPYKKEES